MPTYEKKTVLTHAHLTHMDYEPSFVSGDVAPGSWIQAELAQLVPPEAGRLEPDIDGPEGTFEIIVRFTPKAKP